MIKNYKELLEFIKKNEPIKIISYRFPKQESWAIHTTWDIVKREMSYITVSQCEKMYEENAELKYWYKTVEPCQWWYKASTDLWDLFFLITNK